MIKQSYLAQVVQCGLPSRQAEELWLEIETAYSEAGRYFHDLFHLEHLLKELEPLQKEIRDWPTLFFALVYHDVVYDVQQAMVMNDNEERSAAFAERHLSVMRYPSEKIEKCRQLILATQRHTAVPDSDTNFFTDADLSILGQPWPAYQHYKTMIRQEYAFYPDAIYVSGRRKVLEQFLHRDPLFKTEHFQTLYEAMAKENMKRELQQLQSL